MVKYLKIPGKKEKGGSSQRFELEMFLQSMYLLLLLRCDLGGQKANHSPLGPRILGANFSMRYRIFAEASPTKDMSTAHASGGVALAMSFRERMPVPINARAPVV